MNPIVFIPLTQGMVATIDFDDMELVGRVNWCAAQTGRVQSRFYASRTIYFGFEKGRRKSETQRLHEAIMGAKRADHVKGDSLDNRRSNLRLSTSSQNARSSRRKRLVTTSRFRGVSRMKNGRWIAHIRRTGLDGKSTRTHVGCFSNEVDAAKAYDKAAMAFGYSPEALNFK